MQDWARPEEVRRRSATFGDIRRRWGEAGGGRATPGDTVRSSAGSGAMETMGSLTRPRTETVPRMIVDEIACEEGEAGAVVLRLASLAVVDDP